MACFLPPYWLPLLMLHVLLATSPVLSDQNDPARLLKFKSSLNNVGHLHNWDPDIPPCTGESPNWNGMICNKDGNVFGLLLENMGLSGMIDVDTLAEVTSIRTISFMNNSFEGAMPNFLKIVTLRGIFLSNNKFSGEIGSDAFKGMSSLRRVELANNNFSGKIPTSLTQMPILVDLQLQNNQFEGEIPEFEQKDLKVNFANNRLVGSIPEGLSNQDPSSFAGTPKYACFIWLLSLLFWLIFKAACNDIYFLICCK
ncbi:putative leucine-rich repeat-containing, plant-type, leucine-rich repeat domain superfamily [Helianthus annuus]|uniref:Leucine-rich repeat-containing, plant-type, leucine-rich repeat domain superfamily n=1 Tax=Helianthus annuus TaxID=4232 RepID=A0A251STU5_HELAN|nr:putative leucine-rich repeat-containing, plant-type, leucine-rich repeat domain superfamily [Helianthus annuus]KAJ0477641.1 putative leucine-rich repeat-containing, plant-type, leucine-rich repeat domain superfamily [Helianthus annuus]KAJ0482171.1 putative leucine-rich repeat-containing, plant-type, leucine-rich repeat domain superfamily [Helianthus annuus]KAJ0498472.1 putative leucine-rich repeat-containing, plant-type, leucine-rich repeat domain superfamily [Helianthus annuus]KAJ0664488.1 